MACRLREPSRSGGSQSWGSTSIPLKVEKLERGESYIEHIPDATIRQMREQRFEATVDFERLDEPDVDHHLRSDPADRRREPDLTYIVNSARPSPSGFGPASSIVLESTTYPGTTREVVLPLLSREA